MKKQKKKKMLKDIQINFKLNSDERREFEALAEIYAEGNLSRLIRLAVHNLKTS